MQQQAIVVKTTRAEQQLKLAVSILQAFILFAIFFSQTRRITGYHYIEIGKRINKYKTRQKNPKGQRRKRRHNIMWVQIV